jgi:diguanylate cyclase
MFSPLSFREGLGRDRPPPLPFWEGLGEGTSNLKGNKEDKAIVLEMLKDPMVLTFGAAVSIVAFAVAITILLRKRRGKRLAIDGSGEYAAGVDSLGKSSVSERVFSRDADPLERSKIVIHGLLMEVSESIDSLLGNTTSYGSSLVGHQAAIRKAQSLAAIQEAERILLAEVEEMRSANEKYSRQLAAANAKIKAQQEELEKLAADATLDFLTKIPNRRALDNRLFEEIARSNRHRCVFSVVMMDIDRFKQVNDDLGHLAGDRVLRAVASLLGEEKRETDYLARYGGEEFVLVLPETPLDQALLVAQKMRRRIEASRFTFEGSPIRITISAGVTQVLERGDSVSKVLARSDSALYRAKEGGRNRVEEGS